MVLIEFEFARVDVDDDIFAVVLRLEKSAKSLIVDPGATFGDLARRPLGIVHTWIIATWRTEGNNPRSHAVGTRSVRALDGGTDSPWARRDSMCRRMASRIRASVSSGVSPQATQPGRFGTY